MVFFGDDFRRKCVADLSENDGGPVAELQPEVAQVLSGLYGLR